MAPCPALPYRCPTVPTTTRPPCCPPPGQILDGTPLRYGLPNMSVSKAKFEQKGEQFVERRANKARRILHGAPCMAGAWLARGHATLCCARLPVV